MDEPREIHFRLASASPREAYPGKRPGGAPPPSIKCPRCGLTSYHPMDVQEGFCGRCQDWTRADEMPPPCSAGIPR